ncbi:MAG: 30S ribosomal protein S16 [Deltaproteobacteria bacterium]|nr:30S ribosomal protein S16 [Deltaproteobacteria bacterium]
MVKIRLTRLGSKKRPFYRLVAADSRSPRDGRFLEILGFYNPHTDPVEVHLESERIISWIQKGAKPTDTVISLLKKAGIWQKLKENQAA